MCLQNMKRYLHSAPPRLIVKAVHQIPLLTTNLALILIASLQFCIERPYKSKCILDAGKQVVIEKPASDAGVLGSESELIDLDQTAKGPGKEIGFVPAPWILIPHIEVGFSGNRQLSEKA